MTSSVQPRGALLGAASTTQPGTDRTIGQGPDLLRQCFGRPPHFQMSRQQDDFSLKMLSTVPRASVMVFRGVIRRIARRHYSSNILNVALLELNRLAGLLV